MRKIIILSLWIITTIVFVVFLLFHFSNNLKDPKYIEIEQFFKTAQITTISQKIDLVDQEFENMQKDKTLYGKHLGEQFLTDPFPPGSEYTKYLKNLRYVYERKIIGVDGISGAGKTTFTDRVSMLIAADKSRVLKAMCVPNIDVEMHKRWIGEYDKGNFYPGKFLQFVEKSRKDSLHNYVFIIEDFDKISPQTFFGADIWNELDNPKYVNAIDGYSSDFSLPDNLYIISVYQSGIGATNEFSLEEMRRISRGSPLTFLPDPTEFYIYLNEKYNLKTCSKDTFKHIRDVYYFFIKANELISKKYDPSYQIGQWSGIRKLTNPEQFDEYIEAFVTNVNSFKPQNQLHKEDFDEIIFTLKNDGELYHSNIIYRSFQAILATGLFSEISVGILFAIITASGGWLLYKRKKSFIKSLLLKYQRFIKDYELGKIDFETAKGNLLKMSDDVEDLLLRDKINFPEANYLFTINRQYLEKVDQIGQMAKRSKELQYMMQLFMTDGKLEKDEYDKMISYLESIRPTLTEHDYEEMKLSIHNAYLKTNV